MADYFGSNNWKLAAAATAAAVASGTVVGLLASNLKGSKPVEPKKWVKVGTVTNLILYPIKSCQGIYVEEASCEMIGLKASEYLRDRVFMVVDSRWVFQTQRTIPRMALIRTEIVGNQLILSAVGRDSVTVTIPNDDPKLRRSCRIFDDHVASVVDCGDEVGEWLDGFLEKGGLRLVYHPQDKTQRTLNNLQKKFPTFVQSDKGAFQDQTSYMMISDDSVEELNKLLDKPVSHRNFRPSILINGTLQPFCEDFFGFVKIGDDGPVFKNAKPCTRCKLTTVNPDTGDFDPKGNPLATLTRMQRPMGDETVDRLVKNQGIIGTQFGVFAGAGKAIKIGDPVYTAVL